MLRLRGPALPGSRAALLRVAASEPCPCDLVLPTRSPRYVRRATTAKAVQKRWFRLSPRPASWENQHGSNEGEDDAARRELLATFEQSHSLPDATSGTETSSRSDVIDTALGLLKSTPREKDRPIQSWEEAEKLTRVSRKRGRPQKAATAAKAESSPKKKGRKNGSELSPGDAAKRDSKKSSSLKAAKATEPWDVDTVEAETLGLEPLSHPRRAVPNLSYNLDRCLFMPGVYPLQDPRSRVFNFDPYLSTIMPINEFDFTALKGFVSSSNDPNLITHAAQNQKKYSGSTSSMTSMLSHFHFLLSAWRPINPSQTSKGFALDNTNFSAISRAPAGTFLRWRNGIYAVDADKQYDSANVLSMLGKSMEKLLTLPKEEYEKYRRSKSDQLTEEQKNADESYHYTMMGDFILRSQLDAYDPRLPNEGIFDVKTRAVLSVRMDAKGYEKGKDYEIRYKFGEFESFEREYYDMVRSAFLKYSLQARMGRMDGIFVAYHNTQRIFGFQYFPLEELDHALHGTTETHLGDQEFKLSLHLLNKLLNRATERFPKQPLRIHVEARPTDPPLLYFFAKPVTEERIERAQNIPRNEIEKFEKELMGYAEREKAAADEEKEEDVSEETEEEAKDQEVSSPSVAEINEKAEEAVEDDELGQEHVRRSIEKALEQSGLMKGRAPHEIQAGVEALLETLTNGADRPAGETSDAAEEQRGEVDVAQIDIENELQAQKAQSQERAIDETGPPSEAADQTAEGSGKPFEDSTPDGMNGAPSQKRGVDEAGPPFEAADQTVEGIGGAAEASTVEGTQETFEGSTAEELEGTAEGSTAEPSTAEQQEIMALLGRRTAGPDAAHQDGVEPSNIHDLIRRLANQTEDEEPHIDAIPHEELSRVEKFKQILSKLLTESRGQGEAESPLGADLQGPATDSAPHESDPTESRRQTYDDVLEGDETDEVLGLVLTVRNKIDGEYVQRPSRLSANQKWTVEYSVQTMNDRRATVIYDQLKNRRRKALYDEDERRDSRWHMLFERRLPLLSKKGRSFRKKEEKIARGKPVWIVGEDKEKEWEEVFGKK